MKYLLSEDINPKALLITFTVITFLTALASLVLSHIYLQCLPATILAILFFALNLLFMRLTKIDEFSLNVKTGAIEAVDKEDEQKQNDKGS